MSPALVTKLFALIRLKAGTCVTLFFCLTIGFRPALAQFHFETWTADNGLPQNSVNAIHQTRDGHIWLATFDGPVRYDGVRFTVFNAANTKGIRSSRFTRLYEDRAGSQTAPIARFPTHDSHYSHTIWCSTCKQRRRGRLYEQADCRWVSGVSNDVLAMRLCCR
jgi:Two component regulator propeller